MNLNAINRKLKMLFKNTKKHLTLPSSQTSTCCKPKHLIAFFQSLNLQRKRKSIDQRFGDIGVKSFNSIQFNFYFISVLPETSKKIFTS